MGDGGSAAGTGGSGGVNLGGVGGVVIDGGGGSRGPALIDPKTCEQAAEAKSYIGCEYWPTTVSNVVWSIFDFTVVVANAGEDPADVTIERNGAQVASGTVPPNGLEKFFLPWVPELKGPDADATGLPLGIMQTVRVPGGAYRLSSTLPVTVYQFNALEYKGAGGPPGKDWSKCPGIASGIGCFSFSNDASLLLPTTALTGNYRVTGQKGWSGIAGVQEMCPYIAVTGTQEGTSVAVLTSATATLRGGGGISQTGPGQVVEFTIGRGEVVQVLGTASGDLSGTVVQATAPVQLIHGIPAIQNPVGTWASDHIEESVFPAETLGKHYFVIPPTGPKGDVPGHVVRFYGNVDGTQLQYPSGSPPNAPLSLAAGQVLDIGIVKQSFEVTGDHEFAVGMFQLGGGIVDPSGTKGDPSQSQATAVEQYRTKYVFLAPDDYDVSYVDVTLPDGASVVLDGAALSGVVEPLGGGYSVARALLGSGLGGAHLMVSDQPVGIQVVGYGSATSYQYPGGSNLGLIAPPPPPVK